jgi:hypothetical protein
VSISGKQIPGSLQIVGQAVSVAFVGSRVDAVEKFEQQGRLVMPIPATQKQGDYRLVHLTQFGSTRAWVEEPGAAEGVEHTSLTLPFGESGVYALVRIVPGKDQ